MSAKVKIEITEGPMQGKGFMFDEHDTFLFGRMPDCHACLPNDPLVSRHHFIMEVNPPDARIRDLGSLNGTYVNGVKYGSREEDETPEQGMDRRYPEVDLKDGDRIQVGDTILEVQLQVPAVCRQCNKEIADDDREKCSWIGGTFICPACKGKLMASGRSAMAVEPIRCQKCGKDISAEVGMPRQDNHVCKSCSCKAEDDPVGMLQSILAIRDGVEKTPDIAGYEIEKKLGVGGFGAVYLAKSNTTGQQVAIKVMLSKISVDERSRNIFLREIDVTKAIRHRNIVTLLDRGSDGNVFYFVMDYCDGGSLDRLVSRNGGRLNLTEAIPIMLQSLEGLAFLHEMDHVHRDLKPANILLEGTSPSWTARVSDLGLAKNFQKAGYSGMTVTGSIAGTAPYMPREQVTNFKYVQPVSDIWSIAATFYNMLTGMFPRDFQRGKDPMAVILHGEIVPIRRRDSSIPEKLATVIDRALDNDVKARHQTAGEMYAAMAKALSSI